MTWIKLTSVSIENGSKTVTINSGSTSNIKSSDALQISALTLVEIDATFANQVTLKEAWPHATQTNAVALVVPTFGDFNAATKGMREITAIAQSNLSVIEAWGKEMGTVDFKSWDGVIYTARTLMQMDADVAKVERDALEVANTGIAEAIEQMGGGKLLYVPDNLGQSHLVYRFSPFTYEDLDIPDCPFTGVMDAFLRQDGSIRPYIDVAVHEMCNINGKAASKAAMAPWVSINTDTTRARCEELREDAMMVGRYISAMLGWLMISKGFQPRGNTEYGRSHSNKNEFGRRADGRVPNDRNGSGVILTGTGPDEWRHDGTALGVSNWVGNIWERDEGWKLVDGQIYVSEYMAQPEAEWAATGRFINTGHRFSMADESAGSSNQVWSQFVKDADYIGHELLQRLLIEPIDCTRVLQGRFYYNLDGERFPLRGANWNNAADAGPAAISCLNERSYARSSVGGRFAFAS